MVVEVVVVVAAVTVIVTAPDEPIAYVASAAFEAVTVHVPDDVTDNTAPLSEQPAEPADDTTNDTRPLPEPPEVERVNVEPAIRAVSTRDNALCVRFDAVMVTAPDEAAAYVASAAFEAVTVHVPDDVTDNTEPLSEQPAEPTDETTNDTRPLPEPPEVERVNVEPSVNVVSTRDNAACDNAGPPELSQMAMYAPDDSRFEHVLVPEPP